MSSKRERTSQFRRQSPYRFIVDASIKVGASQERLRRLTHCSPAGKRGNRERGSKDEVTNKNTFTLRSYVSDIKVTLFTRSPFAVRLFPGQRTASSLALLWCRAWVVRLHQVGVARGERLRDLPRDGYPVISSGWALGPGAAPNLPTKIIPAKIARLKLPGRSPMGLGIPPLKIKIRCLCSFLSDGTGPV